MSESPIEKLMRVFAAMDLAKGYDESFKARQDEVAPDYESRIKFLEHYIRKHHVALQLLTHTMDRQGMDAKERGEPFPDKRSDDFKSFEEFLMSQRKGREN